MDPYMSFSPYRREEWKGHATKKAVRQAIRYDRGSGRLVIFSHGHDDAGQVIREIPREEWAASFDN